MLFLEIYHQILYTLLSILYIYLAHVVFTDLPSDPIHVVLYIIHLFDKQCSFGFMRIKIYNNSSIIFKAYPMLTGSLLCTGFPAMHFPTLVIT
jgi:hypothetical protein